MQGSLPPEAQEKVEQLKDLQETAQQVAVQKNEAETELTEARSALAEIETVDAETTMYQKVGELMIETDLEKAREDLEDTVENLEVRIESLEKQESRVEEQFTELQEELEGMLGGAGGPPMGGA